MRIVITIGGSILLKEYDKGSTKKALKESVGLSTMAAVGLGIAGVIILIPRIIVLIREIIYSIYYSRVKIADMLQLQIYLINTNIESLEGGRGTKKVIARQKKIVSILEKWKNRISVKMDTVNTSVSVQKSRDAAALKVDRNSPIMQEPGAYSAGDLML